MNRFQRKESRGIHRILTYSPIQYRKDANYKAVRRRMRKTLRFLMKTNQKAHEEALSTAVNDYARQDLFDTVCIAEAIKFKLVGFNCRREVKNE